MGQCVSREDPFRNGQMVVGALHPPQNPSLSDTSQDNNSRTELRYLFHLFFFLFL